MELQDPTVLDIDAIEHERMDVDVQVQSGAEALNDRHGPTRVHALQVHELRRARRPCSVRRRG